MYTFNLHANQGIEYSSAVSILALIRADTVREPHSRVLFFSISLNKKTTRHQKCRAAESITTAVSHCRELLLTQ